MGVGAGGEAKTELAPKLMTTKAITKNHFPCFAKIWFILLVITNYSFDFMIKKFSSPKIKLGFEPMFFYGFFCGFERCGSAAFQNFRGGTSSPPQAAKCVRTIFRILQPQINRANVAQRQSNSMVDFLPVNGATRS